MEDTKRTIKKLVEKIKKKRKPVFRGRFGNRKLRRKSITKWDKWRKPRGMDIKRKKEDGRYPDSGYRTCKEIRYLHPCGLKEIIVRNLKDLENLKNKEVAIRIASAVGKRKRQEIIKKAEEMQLKVINK
ncbi:MAG: eL32 family ribosomal protein [Candidatus Diapherotrites archaeon]|nr:eL32 family ribosomal protein [Candidatus Diapherotrites archaeon]